MNGTLLVTWASYQIRKIADAHALGMPGSFSPPSQISNPDMRDARVVMHAGIANQQYPLKSAAGQMFPAFPAHAQPKVLRIW